MQGIGPIEYVIPAPPRTITVTGSGNATNCYVTINGENVTAAGIYSVISGQTIVCYVKASSYAAVTVNGTQVTVESDNTYNYRVSKNATIALSCVVLGSSVFRCEVAITEE